MLRKLLFSNLFNQGVPTDYKGKDWESATEEDKIENSLTYRQSLKFKKNENTKHISGRDLREVEYRHLLSKRNIYELIISADELIDSTKFAFIVAFHKADTWKFSEDNWTSEKEVVIDDGDLPVEFIENCKYLPQITYKFTQKYPN